MQARSLDGAISGASPEIGFQNRRLSRVQGQVRPIGPVRRLAVTALGSAAFVGGSFNSSRKGVLSGSPGTRSAAAGSATASKPAPGVKRLSPSVTGVALPSSSAGAAAAFGASGRFLIHG